MLDSPLIDILFRFANYQFFLKEFNSPEMITNVDFGKLFGCGHEAMAMELILFQMANLDKLPDMVLHRPYNLSIHHK